MGSRFTACMVALAIFLVALVAATWALFAVAERTLRVIERNPMSWTSVAMVWTFTLSTILAVMILLLIAALVCTVFEGGKDG